MSKQVAKTYISKDMQSQDDCRDDFEMDSIPNP